MDLLTSYRKVPLILVGSSFEKYFEMGVLGHIWGGYIWESWLTDWCLRWYWVSVGGLLADTALISLLDCYPLETW
jgi:hypothetical protein